MTVSSSLIRLLKLMPLWLSQLCHVLFSACSCFSQLQEEFQRSRFPLFCYDLLRYCLPVHHISLLLSPFLTGPRGDQQNSPSVQISLEGRSQAQTGSWWGLLQLPEVWSALLWQGRNKEDSSDVSISWGSWFDTAEPGNKIAGDGSAQKGSVHAGGRLHR